MSELDLSLDDIIKRRKRPQTDRLKKLGARSGINKPRAGATKSRAGVTNTRSGILKKNSPRKELARLHVSNLDYRVTNEDIRQLFSEIGPLKRAALHYDEDGHSLGTAEVTFTTRDAAIRAIKKYNQVPLDGRPMSITLVPNSTNVHPSPKSRIGVKQGSGVVKKTTNNKNTQHQKGQRRQPNMRASGGKPKFQRRQPKKQITAEELDAELEEFKSKTS